MLNTPVADVEIHKGQAATLLSQIRADVEAKRLKPIDLAREAGLQPSTVYSMLEPDWSNRAGDTASWFLVAPGVDVLSTWASGDGFSRRNPRSIPELRTKGSRPLEPDASRGRRDARDRALS